MGPVPLRTVVLGRLLRVGLDTRLRMGARLGHLEKWWWVLRMGTNGTKGEYSRTRQSPGALLDFLAYSLHVQPRNASPLPQAQPNHI